ncbi:rhodanese-like domain-containing protein [Hymenobacter sp. DH14]|uniref:Rhodanese-like domain-containing protein n=1 Tax=Hymenobacter cyanobacteriorum TaxID=2926463 RepID=A0A9X1VHH1_9BACT|nr:rhodanese-like domain-containing protein [Hymenobacter cyanobacteriorum]MCI1188758.1 rhodanese-like domain-containing protein [Hymenobacter cyanobacteriorum]
MAALPKSTSTYQNLTSEQFAEGLQDGRAVLLDVRRPTEFAQGHLPGARNIDVQAPDFARRVINLDSTRPTYVYCRSGARSAVAATQLKAAGFGHVFNLGGGILDWPFSVTR